MVKRKSKKSVTRSTNLQTKKQNKSLGFAILALVLNIIPIPGLGSLISGKIKAGTWQLLLAILAVFIYTSVPGIYFLGPIILIVAICWGIVTGVRLVKEAQ